MSDLIRAAQAALDLVHDTLLERAIDTKRLTALGREIEAALAAAQQADRHAPAKRGDMQRFAAYLKAHPQECEEFFRAARVDEIVAAAQQAEPKTWIGPHESAWEALDTTRRAVAEVIGADPETWPDHGNAPLAIAACVGLREAELKQQAEQASEPVAWMVYTEDGKSVYVTDNPEDIGDKERALPLFTLPQADPPRPAVRLTEEEIIDCLVAAGALAALPVHNGPDPHYKTTLMPSGNAAVRAVEAAVLRKNGMEVSDE